MFVRLCVRLTSREGKCEIVSRIIGVLCLKDRALVYVEVALCLIVVANNKLCKEENEGRSKQHF